MITLDTNAVLRFLLRDIPEQGDYVKAIISQRDYLVPIEVIAEAVHVLSRLYGIDRQAIAELILGLVSDGRSIFPNQTVVEMACQVYADTKFDFVDCLMVGYSRVDGHDIITFDKKLNNYIRRQIP